MKRLSLLCALLGALLVPTSAHAADKLLGTITVASTSSAVTNATTATPFPISVGDERSTATSIGVVWIVIQCDLPVWATFDGATAASSTTGQKFDTDQLSLPKNLTGNPVVTTITGKASTTISIVGVTSSTTNCKVWSTTDWQVR